MAEAQNEQPRVHRMPSKCRHQEIFPAYSNDSGTDFPSFRVNILSLFRGLCDFNEGYRWQISEEQKFRCLSDKLK